MDQKQLRDTLKLLHQELSETKEVDAAAVTLLKTVTEDIERLLDKSSPTDDDPGEPVTHGLQELLLKFKGEHPRLATMIEQITDGLANLGI